MSDSNTGPDPEFEKRREAAKARINQLDEEELLEEPDRGRFFADVYQLAEGDAAGIPWADMKPKSHLVQWLEGKSGIGLKAVDIGCGLGDNAEAIEAKGYDTVAFDFSPDAIRWAKERFPDSNVDYRIEDLSKLPESFAGTFDLVSEIYTLQSIPPQTVSWSLKAVADLVAPGGTLLVYARIRADGSPVSGPPWPLEEKSLMGFDDYGLRLISRQDFNLIRPEREIPHVFCEWRRD